MAVGVEHYALLRDATACRSLWDERRVERQPLWVQADSQRSQITGRWPDEHPR